MAESNPKRSEVKSKKPELMFPRIDIKTWEPNFEDILNVLTATYPTTSGQQNNTGGHGASK
jgi:hypothetical protein